MTTLHRQRYRYWFRLIIIIVIASFLSQDTGWATTGLLGNTLYPTSGLSEPDSSLRIEFAKKYFIDKVKTWSKGKRLDIPTLFRLLKKNTDDIQKDLDLSNINVILYDKYIELISPYFTLVFLDNNQIAEEWYHHRIPGTDISIYLQRHTHLLQAKARELPQKQKVYIEGVDNQRLESALGKEKIVQSHSGIRINFGEGKDTSSPCRGTHAKAWVGLDTLTDEEKIIACLYAYNYLGFMCKNIKHATGETPKRLSFVIGHDPQPTATALLETQVRGFLAAAMDLGVELEIVNLGMLPKPMYQNAVRSFEAHGGVYLTASHNELNWNCLEYATRCKMEGGFTFGGSLLNAGESRELIRSFSDSVGRLMSGDLGVIEGINNTCPVFEVDKDRYELAKRNYKGFISGKFGPVTGVKVVLDPNGGAGCGIYKEILEELGFTVVEINSSIGRPGHKIDPEKAPGCYTELAKIISREAALFGMTFDYDGDRAYLTILDSQGNPLKISPQDTAAINVATVLKWCKVNSKLTPKTAIVVNDATSGRVIEIARQFDVEVFCVETGETNLVNKMHELRKEGYYVPVAVEGSNGGTIFFDSMCRDGLLSTISVALRETVRELREPIPQYYTESDEIRDLDISIRDLKMRIEEFIRENQMGFCAYEVHYFEGTSHIINKSKMPGSGMTDETGGWKLVLRTMDGEEHFIWLRPSKTEPNIIRLEFDSPEKEMLPKLKKLFRLATMGKRYTVSSDSREMSHKAAEYFVNEVNRLIEEKGMAVVCFATGDTPREMYRIIRTEYENAVDWSKVIAFHLDEYVFSIEEYPLDRHRYSYRYFLQEEIFKHLHIPEENIHFLDETNPSDDAFRFYKDTFLREIREAGGIDLCILGIGKNGHIGFNEPGSGFDSTARKVKLQFSTRWANRKAFGKWWQFWSVFKVPKYAFTMGIQEIMASKKVMLLARGKDKTEPVQKSLFGPVTEEIPASILQRHPDVRYFLDEKAFGLNKDADEVEELGSRLFGHMPRMNLIRRLFNVNWWRDKSMYWGMRLGPIKRWLMKMIDKYPTLPIYKKIPLFWFGLGMRFIAPRFIAGDTVEKATGNILRLRDKKIDYTVDILGEAVTSEEEAEENKKRYLSLLDEFNVMDLPANLSLKLTGLVSRLDHGNKETVKRRLRDILHRAIEAGAFITIDMEQYRYKDLTLEIYKEILEEKEFENCNNLQIVLQVYLRDSPKDIEEFIGWAKQRYERTGARASVRLVKGAYWNKEVQWAREGKRPPPVWSEKWQSNKNYEDMAALLLKNHQCVRTVFATHNVRSMARIIYEAQKNKIPENEIEFQMLYGMGEPFQDALVKMGYRVRAYVPYGPLLKGLKYFARRIEENTSQESFLLQSLSGKYEPSELLKEPCPGIGDYRKRFNQALARLLKLSPWDFIPGPIKDKLEGFNSGNKPRYYSFDSLDRLRRFTRWGYLWRLIRPDEVIVVRLILPGKNCKRLFIAALRFRDLKERVLKKPGDINIVDWGKTYFLIDRDFDTNDCVIKGEGLHLHEGLREQGWGSMTFRLSIQRLIESGFGGYPYVARKIENPKLLHLVYEELDGRINTTNTGLTSNFIDRFERIGGEHAGKIKEFKRRPKRKAREFLGFLVGLSRRKVPIDWKALKTPVEGTIPGIAEPRSPKGRFKEMLSSSKTLEEYKRSGRLFELIPEWRDWIKLYDSPNFKNYHHLSPEEHITLAFSRLEGSYFQGIIERARLKGTGLVRLRRALFLHDFGKILALQRDPDYSHASHIAHPGYSAKMAEEILLRLGYRAEEIADDILLIRHHEVLKDLAQSGKAEIEPLEFVNSLKLTLNLRLLQVLQLVDAASVRHQFENSLSIGLERRVNEIADIIEAILVAGGEQRPEQEARFLNYLEDIKRQNSEIELAFAKFKEAMDRHGINIDEKILQDAFLAMHRSHLGQLRKDGRTPSTIHPIETATILVDELKVKDPNWLIAALLHDVLEDTRTTVGAIELAFGKEVASIVRLLSKPDIRGYANKDAQDMDFYHRIIYGADGIEDRDILTAAQTIKIADRINNLRTLNPRIAARQINETYEVFIHYFLGETEVSPEIKRALIKELISQGMKWRILTPGHVGELTVLARDIMDFKIPGIRIEASPYNFIRGLVEHRQKVQPGTPLVLAFNGMSGVGRTTFTAHLQKQLQGVGKKVVVFDANDYLLPRPERNKILRRARQTGGVFYGQREEFYDIKRFKKEVWGRLEKLKKHPGTPLSFKLSRLYNRLTGELDAPRKEYETDRNTIILIEGIHIFQKDLMPLYDATFLVYAPREVCLANVLERENEKPEETRQPHELIIERFGLVDWPSYTKHLVEYWRASGFVIDNTDYRNPLVKKNPFPRYPEKAHDVPKEFTDPHEWLNRNLENIFRQLKDKGISPYDIIPEAKSHIDIFRNLLAIKGAEQLFKQLHPPISLPDMNVDSLDYFLDQLTTQPNIVDIFFRLFAIYIQSLKTLPPIIFNPSFPQELLLQILSKRRWDEAKFTPNFILYRSNGLYIEVPRVGSIAIGDQERQFVYRHPVLRFIYGLLNRYNHIRWVRGLRELLKWLLHYFKPQRIISGEYMKGYRLIMEKAPHLITQTRIVEDDALWEKIRLKGMARQNKALILQLSEGKLLIDYTRDLVNQGAWGEVEKTLEDAFNFLEGLFQYGIADIDPDVNIWENLVVTADGRLKTCDAESITDDISKAKAHCTATTQEASFVLGLLGQKGIQDTLKHLESAPDKPNCFIGLIKTLLKYFDEDKASRLVTIFLNKLVEKFALENLERLWEKGTDLPKSYTGKGGTDKECNPIIERAFGEERAQVITSEPITLQAKAILLEDERFTEKEGFREVRVAAIPDLPLDGHYGMGGAANEHTLPTIYIPKKLYDYLLERHNKDDLDARIELADYLYHKYMEMRLAKLGDMSAKEAHRIVDHSEYKKEKKYITRKTYKILSSARKRLLFYFEIRERLGDVGIEFVRWILKSYPPYKGRRHLAVCQRDANPLGVMLRAAIQKLGWTHHLVVTDVYLNKHIVADWRRGYVVQGNNSPEEIFEYLHQEGILDGCPITFIDTGIYGSIPMICEDIIRNPELWRKTGKTPASIDIETKLLYFVPGIGTRGKIQGLNQIMGDMGNSALALSKWLEDDFPRKYSSPERLIKRKGRIVPDLQKNPSEQKTLAGIAEYTARDLVFEKIAFGELFSATRGRIKMAIRELLVERQDEEHKKDAGFRRGFEKEIESQVSNLHELVSDEEVGLLSSHINSCTAGPLEELNLADLHKALRDISGLDLLDSIKQSYIGPPASHVSIMPWALARLAMSHLNFFKLRFVETNEETEGYLLQMRGILEELYTEKDVFNAFVLAFLLHDYGMLLMQSGANSHAKSGGELLSSFLNKLLLTDRQKAMIRILVEEHAKLYLMLAGHVTPFNYEHSLQRLKEYGIPRALALKMYALFLFLDTSSCKIAWARENNWLSNEFIKRMLYFTDPENLDRFKENYLKKRLALLAGDKSIDSTLAGEVEKEEYVNRIWFNSTKLSGAVLSELSYSKSLKLLYLLAKIYRHSKLDPDEIEVYLIADKDSADTLGRVLDSLTIEKINTCPDPAAIFPFKIKITEQALVINLRAVSHGKAFRQAVSSVIQNAASPPAYPHEARGEGDRGNDQIVSSMAWHVLEGLGMNKDFKGKIVYSLTALLESSLNDGNRTTQLRDFIGATKGRVVFYAGNGCLEDPDYDFLKGSLVNIEDVSGLVRSGELMVFMLDSEHRRQLGIGDLTPGQLTGNQFVVPVSGDRDVLDDISLGLEIIRNQGNINALPSLFKILLIEAIEEWLRANGEEPTPERIKKILQIEIPVSKKDYPGDIERSYALLTSV